MSKKVIAACMAVAAVAAFSPMAASASPILTSNKGGPAVAVGTKITATNVGVSRLKNDEGTTTLSECSSTKLTGELIKNNGTEIEGNVTTATSTGTGAALNGMNECTGTFGNFSATSNGGGIDGENVESGTPWCLKAGAKLAADEFQIRGGKCTEAARKIRMIIDLTVSTTIIECKYQRVEPLKGTFTTEATGDAALTMTAGTGSTVVGEAGNNFICPVSGTLELAYTLEKDEATASPFYVS